MQMTTDARAWLHATVQRILARQPLGETERAGITYELMSHLHAAGEERARLRGAAEVALEDLEGAHAKAGGDAGLAAAFVEAVARPVERASFGPRLAAFAIDALLLGIGLVFLHGVIVFLLGPLWGVAPSMVPGPDGTTHAHDLAWWLPWGFHDPTLPLGLQGLIALASAALVAGYFTCLEGGEGRTLGKRALDLRAQRADGRPLGYREAFLRNVAKVSLPLLVLDALLLLTVFQQDRQRLSDRIAESVVVRA